MEIQFQKNAISHLKTILRHQKKQEETQQVRLPDAMPDMDRVLGCWGQILVRGKQWHRDSVGISGGVMAWVMYEAKGESEPRCVDAWIPFQMSWDMEEAERDGTVEINTMLCYMDARMLSDRKLLVRANIGAQVHAMVPVDTMLYAPSELSADVQMLQRTYPVMLPIEAGEKQFELSQQLDVPQDGARINKLIRYSAKPKLTEYKIVADKLVLRGIADVHAVYLDETCKIYRQCWEVPFSQYAQLEGEYSPEAEASVCFALTQLELEITQPDALELKLGFTAQYTVSEQRNIVLTEDMYSPGSKLELTEGKLDMPSVLQVRTENFRVEVPAPEGQLLDVVFEMEPLQVTRHEDAALVTLEGTFQILYMDTDGNLQSAVQRWEKEMNNTVSQDAEYWTSAFITGEPELGPGVSAELQWEEKTVAMSPMKQIVAAEIGEAIQPDPQRPSLILRRAGQESLWDIAKSTGSTMDAIRKANGLQQEPEENQLLLIPVN